MRTLPHIAELLVPKITDATDWADTVVVTSPDPVYAAEVARLGADKVVLDFAEFHRPRAEPVADERRILPPFAVAPVCRLEALSP